MNPNEARDLSLHYYQNGYYCSEAVLRAFNEVYDLGLPENGYKMATGFGSGMAESGCACGAITAGVMVLGLVAGRTHKGESEELVYAAVAKLQTKFKQTYKTACCKVLTRDMEWGSKAHKLKCENYVLLAAEVTESILQEELYAYLPSGEARAVPRKFSLKMIRRRLYDAVSRNRARTR